MAKSFSKERFKTVIRKVSFSYSVHIEANKKQLFNQRFLRVSSDRLNFSLVRIMSSATRLFKIIYLRRALSSLR